MLERINEVRKGKVVYSYEIEDSDKEAIKEQLIEAKGEFDYFEDQATIELTGDITNNLVEFDVTVSDYLTPEEWVRSLNFDYLLDNLIDKYNVFAISEVTLGGNFTLYSYKEGYYQAIKNLNILNWDNLAGLDENSIIKDFIFIKGL